MAAPLMQAHASNPIPDYFIAQTIFEECPQVIFNVKTGEWTMMTPVRKELTDRYYKELKKTVAAGVAIGLAAGYVAGPIAGGALAQYKGAPMIIAGGVLGGAAGGSIIYIKSIPPFRRLDFLENKVDKKVKEILDALFDRVGEQEGGQQSLIDPVLNSLFHIPVITPCNAERDVDGELILDDIGNPASRSGPNHTFEFYTIKKIMGVVGRLFRVNTPIKCPLCRKIFKITELELDRNLRKRIGNSVSEALYWLNSLHGEMIESEEGYEHFLENSENVDEVIEAIRNGTLSRDQSSFLSYLVKGNLKLHNKKVGESYMNLISILNQKSIFMNDEQYDRVHESLREWKKGMKIIPRQVGEV